jgi:two-component system, NarL family, sensor kinase
VQKHAACQNVRLQLDYDRQVLRLSIEDDGRGFDAESVSQHPSRGIGLRNMRERIEGIGGRLVVVSKPGLTRISAELPRAALRRFAAAAAAEATA